jgi:hypothetical protein
MPDIERLMALAAALKRNGESVHAHWRITLFVMRKLQMICHILVAHETRLPCRAGQRGHQRIRKTMVAPRNYFKISDGTIVKD